MLAINDGASEAVASEFSGLRTTQVRYWLNKYQKMGMAIFPTDMLQGIEKSATITAESTPDEAQQTVEEASKEQKSKKVKKKKDKKKKNNAKRSKRSKKAQKAKKGKGGKPKKKKK